LRKLIIAEKFNTAIRIASILAGGKAKRTFLGRVPAFEFTREDDTYVVLGMRGHILNLDYPDEFNDWQRVDLKRLVWVEPVKKVTAQGLADALFAAAPKADMVIVATDYDREGELIGVEGLELIRSVNPHVIVKRARYSALAKGDIEDAFANLVDVDVPLARAAESRQLVDLAWGAALTRFLSLAANQVGKDFLSVGRVQSPTLALVVDRDREIEEFVPKDFWTVRATLRKDDATFLADHERNPFWVPAEAEAARIAAAGVPDARVLEYVRTEREEWPPVPFNTTAFLAEANRLGYGAAQTMSIAESLYQGGWISYPRTDNTVYPPTLNLRGVLKKLEESELSAEARELGAQERIRARRGPVEATDHPPIYPVAGAKKSQMKRADHWRIYELVARRFLATVAPNCIVDASEAKLDANGEPLSAEGHVVKAPGWRAYYPYWRVREAVLPELTVGESVAIVGVESAQDHTQPPPAHTQGTLLHEMERLGLGTKSTRHEIIQKLYDRKYVAGRSVRPTLSGRAIVEALADHASRITKPEMTAHLEADMDGIARGVKDPAEVVRESQQMLSEVIAELEQHEQAIGQEISAALKEQNYIGKCEVCGAGSLMVLHSRRGRRFLGCDRYPACRNTHPLPQFGIIAAADTKCPACGSPMVRHVDRGRTADFCVASKCPTVREKNLIGACGKCGTGELMILHSARGKRFVGCTNYPACDNSFPLPQRGLIIPTKEVCPTCGSPKIRVIIHHRKPWVPCINMECPEKIARRKAKAAAARARARRAKGAASRAAKRRAPVRRSPKAKAVPAIPAASPTAMP